LIEVINVYGTVGETIEGSMWGEANPWRRKLGEAFPGKRVIINVHGTVGETVVVHGAILRKVNRRSKKKWVLFFKLWQYRW
jgi:hypothetical protein